MQSGLFTIGILAYNNYNFIKEAIDSVLNQNYDSIEIIINNDGSKDFNEQELFKYICENKKNNIKNIIIHNNEENVGTVKSANYICKNASGEYFMLMAADDALYDQEVFGRYVQEFSKRDEKVLMAKIAMCGLELSDEREYIPSQGMINLLKSQDNKRIFSRLTHDSFMPTTSTCYKIELLEETGYFDEKYFIIEDASKFIYLARKGYKFGWIDNFIASRHRDGGVSHGNSRNKSESYRRYRFDELLLFVDEILPYKEQILPKDQKLLEKKWKYIKGAYYRNFLLNDEGNVEYRNYDKDLCLPIINEMKKEQRKESIKTFIRTRAETISLKVKLRSVVNICCLIIFTSFLEFLDSLFNLTLFGNTTIIKAMFPLMYLCLFVLLAECFLKISIRVVWDIIKIYKGLRAK